MGNTEVRIAGFGGQGVILAGVLLGTAAVLCDGRHALQTQTYGAAARGGAARSDVIISDEEIVYPQVTSSDIMVAFTTEALNKYRNELKPDATLIIDEDLVKPDTKKRTLSIPATRFAEQLGNRIFANVVMLGFVTATTGVVSVEAMKKTIPESVPERFIDRNLDAFDKGYEFGQKEIKQ